ncbi:MAG: hypothetical protein JWO95_444 [Verrucomicrobiales bacterium]|nr:hypothetical protein [Verrucomicrobiales bacterium]
MQNFTLITAIAGLVFGFLGAVLGVINTWRAITQDRLKVRVRPISRLNADTREEVGYGIDVTNLSKVPVTISMVGFATIDKDIFLTFRGITGCNLPERMEPRTSFTAILPITNQKGFERITCAFAETACGQRFKGTSPNLKAKIAAARRA